MPAAVQPVHNLNWNRPFSQAKSATSILPLLLYRVGGPIRAPAFGVRTRCSRYCLLLLVLKSTSSIDLDRPILILYAQSAFPAEESVVSHVWGGYHLPARALAWGCLSHFSFTPITLMSQFINYI